MPAAVPVECVLIDCEAFLREQDLAAGKPAKPHGAPEGYREDIAAALASVLLHLASSEQAPRGPTRFHSNYAPSLGIGEYLARISKYFGCSESCYVLGLVYIDRILMMHPSFGVGPRSIHRLVCTSVMVAAKFIDDEYLTNSYYSKVGGLKLQELNCLEANFLQLLRWRLQVDPEEYDEYLALLRGHAHASENGQASRLLRHAAGVPGADGHLKALLEAVPHPCWVFTAAHPEHADRCLRRLGVADRFLGVISPSSPEVLARVGNVSKHDPRCLAAALDIAGVRGDLADRCVVVGAHASDLRRAKQMGCRTVLIDPRRLDDVADALLEVRAEIPELFMRPCAHVEPEFAAELEQSQQVIQVHTDASSEIAREFGILPEAEMEPAAKRQAREELSAEIAVPLGKPVDLTTPPRAVRRWRRHLVRSKVMAFCSGGTPPKGVKRHLFSTPSKTSLGKDGVKLLSTGT